MKTTIACLLVACLVIVSGCWKTEVKYKDGSNNSDLKLTPGKGLGDVTFGMSKKEVIKIFGKADFTQDFGKGVLLGYASQGFEFVVKEGQGVTMINCFASEYLARSTNKDKAKDFAGTSDMGIKIGASEKDVIKTYGPPTKRSDRGGGVVLKYMAPTIMFEFKNDKLLKMMIAK